MHVTRREFLNISGRMGGVLVVLGDQALGATEADVARLGPRVPAGKLLDLVHAPDDPVPAVF